jgi:hypothetical protein
MSDFSLFWKDGWQPNDEPEYEGLSLEEFVQAATNEFGAPFAWAARFPVDYTGSGRSAWESLRAESIAAGRLIDCIDGKYIPRIPSLPADATEQAEIDAAKCQPAHVSHVEPERKPLDWNKSTPFDSFGPGFVVTSGANPGWDTFQGLQGGHSHPLQRMNEGGNALHGSAALLKD